MTRVMYDAISANADTLLRNVGGLGMVAYYVTGSPDIRWSDAQVAMFPNSEMISIDQGFTGSPVRTAMVRDVEPNAWTPANAVDLTNWDAERPTIYCDRSDLQTVIAEGWKGDVWLAYPGWSGPTPPTYPGVNVVAVQRTFDADWDVSTVYDPYWPHKPPVGLLPPDLSVTVVKRVVDIAFNVHVNAGHYVVLYYSKPGAPQYLVGRASQPASGNSVHLMLQTVPNNSGGIIDVYAIVNAQAIPWGSVNLP